MAPYKNPDLVSRGLQSFVEGLDVDWSAPMDVPVFNYTRIPFGEYRVHIRAFNGWNLRSKEAKEKELIRLRNEKLNAGLSFKSQELANSTMAFIKKNEFLMELKETLKTQKDDLGTRYPVPGKILCQIGEEDRK